ncbi:hypothetical protein QPK87_14945 [Kamptonema cortianum]|nr:hypothetical protein [Kamptonema cortianum]
MSRRIRKSHEFPPLENIFPDFKGLQLKPTRTVSLLNYVRTLCQKLQRADNQPFYSTREIAAFFKTDQKVAVQVFAALEAEGLLARIRATGTVLLGYSTQVPQKFRGIVTLPLWQHGYSNIVVWRKFLQEFDASLLEHYFVISPVFFSQIIPERAEEFVAAMIARNPAHVVWFKPLPEYRLIMDLLRDHGVGSIVIVDNETKWKYPIYRLDRTQAVRQALKSWQASGIRKLHLFHLDTSEALRKGGYDFLSDWKESMTFHSVNCFSFEERVKQASLGRHDGLLFIDEDISSQIPWTRMGIIPEITHRYRVLIHAPIFSYAELYRGCRADVIDFNWTDIAGQIVTDIATRRTWQRIEKRFYAKLISNAELESFTSFI